MLRTLGRHLTGAVEALLPKATADAGCPPDPYTECTTINGYCYCRRCSTNLACVVYCGSYSYTINGC